MICDSVLVTGAGGFIGSHLTELLVELGYQAKAFVRYNSRDDWGWLNQSKYKKEIEIFSGDIRDYDSVERSIRSCKTVFHLAALIGIPYSYISPLAYIKTNIEGTYNILEASRKRKIENILITSTSETYGTAQYVPIDEKHPMIGQSPYAASKISADQLAISYYCSFGLPIKIIRPFNIYGPRQSARAVIPTIIIQILNKQPKIKLGNLHPTRDFTFVKDAIKGFVEIAKADKFLGEITHIGMNNEISIGELAKLIERIMHTHVEIEREEDRVRIGSSEVERLCCNNSKILKSTNWKPTYNLEKGISETIDWFRNNIKFYRSEKYIV